MECNKEEASRAKDAAEIKLRNADYVSAKRMALKAQRLFPGIENISQLLAVCEVHCCTSVKINGETDWYGILQVEPTADNVLLKKQYRKLALLLHPDKNKFAGAEAAFKLIGEAHMTLTDQVKRSFHDKKRKSVFATSAPSPTKRRQAPQKTDAKKVNKENIPDISKNLQQQSGHLSFWTICLTCGTKYQYPLSFVMKHVLCQICSSTFLAYDLSKRPFPVRGEAPYTWGGSGKQPQKFPPSQQAHVTNEQQKYQSVPGCQNTVTGHQTHATQQQQQSRNVPDQQTPVESQKLHSDARSKNFASSQAVSDSNNNGTAHSTFTAKAGTCNSKKASTAAFKDQNGAVRTESPISSSHKCSRQSQNVPDQRIPVATQQQQCEKPPLGAGSKKLKRSSQKENNAASKGDLAGSTKRSDDLTDSPVARKISKGYPSCNVGKSCETINVASNVYSQQSSFPKTEKNTNENGEVVSGLDHNVKKGIHKEDKMPNAAGDGVTRSADGISFEGVSYPDPEFYDFEKERDADRFRVDQIWAVYDDYNSMPRYYARIMQVYSPNFMLQFTWLEVDPQNDAQKAWSSEELPVACGSFRIGKTNLTEDKNMFSHVVSAAKGRKRNSFEIYPRKGEVWALFKGWHINWSSDSSGHQLCSYDIVKVQSDFVAGTGTYVIPLVKLKGFVSLYVQSDSKEAYLIPDGDTLKFSHSIPFHMLAEAGVQHIPHSALELDPASLPSDMEEAFSSVDLGQGGKTGGNASSTTHSSSGEVPVGKTKHGLCGASADECDDSSEPKSPTSFVYPEPEFCNFTLIRSFKNFKNGQIWALYCDTDKFPKYYGLIKKVDPDDCTIHIRWLEYCPCVQTEKSLMQEGHPVSCGTFKVSNQSDSYDCTSVFSHIVEVATIDKGKKYDILPCAGQVWAVYKNWSCDWSLKNYKICEYDFVEVLKTSASSIIVYYLTKVEGFSSVFMPEEKGGSRMAIKIQRSDMMMFSHQIPAYGLTLKEDKPFGHWELDPASVPETFLDKKAK